MNQSLFVLESGHINLDAQALPNFVLPADFNENNLPCLGKIRDEHNTGPVLPNRGRERGLVADEVQIREGL